MAHPTREQWMAYLYGESVPDPEAGLTEHLENCAECQKNVDAWRGVMAQLDVWKLPDKGSRIGWKRRVVQWAAAAVLLLGIGYGVGRIYPDPGPDLDALRAALEPRIRQSLREELTSEWKATLVEAWSQMEEDLYEQLQTDLSELATQAFIVSNAHTNRVLSDLVISLEGRREEDWQTIAAVFGELESRRISDNALLRNDVQTLAVFTEDELLRTKRGIGQLLAWSQAVSPVSEVYDGPDVDVERGQK